MVKNDDGPWWTHVVKEIGGLGLVLIMLVGIYLLADTYLADMQATWRDIRSITQLDVREREKDRIDVRDVITTFMASQNKRMTELDVRMNEVEKHLRSR